MPSSWYSIVVDAHEPGRLAHWWAEVLGYQVVFEAVDEVAIARDTSTYPGMVFVSVPERKAGKNWIHVDLNPDDQEAEVRRLEGMGARRRAERGCLALHAPMSHYPEAVRTRHIGRV